MKKRAKKFLRWLAIFFGGVLLLCLLFLAEEHIRGRVTLNRYIKRMRALGEKFTIQELTPIPALPAENGSGLMMSVSFP